MKALLYIFSLFLLVSCAQQSMLTGGDKDIISPILLEEKTIPANYSTNFNSPTVHLQFNEYIQLKDLKKNFFVNPPIEKIRIEEKGKSVLIHLEEPLLENTTYTFNFGAAIQDITENNTYKDFKYIMSTGDFIDSTFYWGIIYDAFSKKPLENIKVFLYQKLLDSLNENILPMYMGFSDLTGRFRLNNLKKNSYFVLAVDDNNKNNEPNPKSEKIAFDTSSVISLNPGDTSFRDTLLLFLHDLPLKVIEKKYTPPGRFDVVFNKKVESADLKTEGASYHVFKRTYPSDTFTFWLDSIPSGPLSFKLIVQKEKKLKKMKVNTYISKSKDTLLHFKERNINNLRPDKPLQLIFDHPLKKVNSNKLHFLIDSIESDPVHFFDGILWSMELPNPSDVSLELLAEPGAFESIYGFKNDSIHLFFRQKNKASYGEIYLNVSCNNCNAFIVQLLKKDAIIQSFNCDNRALNDTVTMCSAGTYMLRLIKDLNGDGKWTTGDFLKSIQPEPIYFYTEPIEIKSGWNLDVQWVIQ